MRWSAQGMPYTADAQGFPAARGGAGLAPLAQAISAVLREKGRCVAALDGMAAAGKTTAAALLCEGESVLSNMVQCNDTRAALQVAADLGAKISAHEDTYTLHGGLHPRKRQLNIGESGLATRLFTPITALCTETITLTGKGSILKRPISMMEEPLRQLGATVSSQGGYLPIHIRGAIRGGNITVDGSLSSQFITGLLMALPLAAQDTTLTVNDLKSRPYIDMTIGLLKNFGIDIKHNDYRQFFIEGGQRYVPTRYRIEGDWSAAATLLVAGAVAGEVTLHNVSILSKQADTAVCTALVRAGAELIHEADRITVRRRPLRAFEFDATQCPDLFPPLAALAAACEGESLITGTSRLAHKESDRAETLREEYAKVGIEIDLSTPDVMRIRGGAIRPARVFSHGDHRIAMSMAVSALRSSGTITIEGAEAVAKSYPRFFEDLESLRVN